VKYFAVTHRSSMEVSPVRVARIGAMAVPSSGKRLLSLPKRREGLKQSRKRVQPDARLFG
jgi:hypothetical protein